MQFNTRLVSFVLWAFEFEVLWVPRLLPEVRPLQSSILLQTRRGAYKRSGLLYATVTPDPTGIFSEGGEVVKLCIEAL